MPKVYLQSGHLYEATMPYSEVCMHMRVAGEQMVIELVGTRAVQLYQLDGKPFSAPITHGEAGVFEDEGGLYINREG